MECECCLGCMDNPSQAAGCNWPCGFTRKLLGPFQWGTTHHKELVGEWCAESPLPVGRSFGSGLPKRNCPGCTSRVTCLKQCLPPSFWAKVNPPISQIQQTQQQTNKQTNKPTNQQTHKPTNPHTHKHKQEKTHRQKQANHSPHIGCSH